MTTKLTEFPHERLRAQYALEPVEPGYWLGEVGIMDLPFHVEVIELRFDRKVALNASLDTRLGRWYRARPRRIPQVCRFGSRRFFIHVEVHAS